MEMRLIKTEEDYNNALARMEDLFDVTPDSKDFEEAELLMALIEMYEEKHYKIEAPDPIEAIKFRMEQTGMKPTELAKFLGTRSRVSEILNRKRKLTVKMMRILHKQLGIPAESLLA
jgi:HTH-type transcriptional regulator/antitoxin HigA